MSDNVPTLCVPSARDYCKDLKPLKNNTAFLKEFLEYIDRKTPNNPMCESSCTTLPAVLHNVHTHTHLGRCRSVNAVYTCAEQMVVVEHKLNISKTLVKHE